MSSVRMVRVDLGFGRATAGLPDELVCNSVSSDRVALRSARSEAESPARIGPHRSLCRDAGFNGAQIVDAANNSTLAKSFAREKV